MSTANPAPVCKGKTKNGKPCQAYAIGGSEFCYTHDPASAKGRAQSRRKGGKARHGREIKEDKPFHTGVKLESMADALALIARAANDAARMENSLSRAKLFISAAVAYGRLFEASELAARLEALEERFHEQELQNANRAT